MIPIIIGGAVAAAAGGLALYNRGVRRKAERSVPPDGSFIDIAGNRLHYVDRGPRDAPAIVLIHGLGGQLRNFARPLVEDLERDHRVVLVDRPGSGWSRRAPDASSSLWQQAETMAKFIQALGLDRPAIVGHSLGGALALTIAAEHPEVVSRLALICPLTQDERDIPPVFKGLEVRSPLMRRLIASTIAVPVSVANQDKILAEIFKPEPVPADFLVAGGGALGLRSEGFYETSSDLVALEHQMPLVAERYPNIKIPVRILYGREDNLLPPKTHGIATAAQLPDGRCDVVAGGHMLPFTQPEVVARWLRGALAHETTARETAAAE